MDSVTISPKFQVVIPRRVRESMHLKPGQKVQVVQHGTSIELVPIRRMSDLRGILKDVKEPFVREEDEPR